MITLVRALESKKKDEEKTMKSTGLMLHAYTIKICAV